jgi:hypothetical protein
MRRVEQWKPTTFPPRIRWASSYHDTGAPVMRRAASPGVRAAFDISDSAALRNRADDFERPTAPNVADIAVARSP